MAHPTLPAVPDERLRPALDAAFAVAVEGRRARPPVAPPEPLRAYLRFRKPPRSALAVIRTVLDDDAGFRARVTATVDPAVIGAGPYAWLARPDGWEAVAEAELGTGERAAPDRAVASSAREAKRRAAADAAGRRAAAEVAELRDALAHERAERAAGDAATDELRQLVAALREEIDGLQRRARRAEASAAERATELESALAAAAASRCAAEEAAALRDEALAERARAEQALAAATRVHADDDAPARVVADDGGVPVASGGDAAGGETDAPDTAWQAAVADVRPLAGRADRSAAGGRARSVDRAGDAAAAVRDAASSLRRAAQALESAVDVFTVPAPPSAGLTPSAPAVPPVPPRHRRTHTRARRRRPVAMPGGVSAASVDGALHLMRSPGLELVVDGYNVAKRAWPALELADQRERCIDAVEDIVRRFGTRALIVFDGADVAVAVSARRLARVQFSPPGTLADDVIRDVVAGLPVERAVAVATNDREVVESVRALGANTIASEILLAAAGRSLP